VSATLPASEHAKLCVQHAKKRATLRNGEESAQERPETAPPRPANAPHRDPAPRPLPDTSAPHRSCPHSSSAACSQSSAVRPKHSIHTREQGGGACLGGLDRCRVLGARSRRVAASPPCAMYADGRQRLAAIKQGGRWRRGGAVGRWAAARAATATHVRHEGFEDPR